MFLFVSLHGQVSIDLGFTVSDKLLNICNVLHICGRRQLGEFLLLLNINDMEAMADSSRPQH